MMTPTGTSNRGGVRYVTSNRGGFMGLLTDAVSNRDFQKFEELLMNEYEFDKKINEEQDANGDCALIIAAKRGFTEMIAPLLAAEAYVNQTNKDQITALYAATEENHIEVMKVLLAHPGIVAKPNNNGHTPLSVAIQKGFFEGAKLLLESKIPTFLNQKVKGETLLNMAAAQGDEALALVELIIKADSTTVNTKGLSDWTALHHAVKANASLVIKILVDSKAFLDPEETNGKTPLHLAVELNSLNTAKVLLENGANARATYGQQTALVLAKQHQHEGMVNLLRDHLRANPQTAAQAQLLSEDDAKNAIHIDLQNPLNWGASLASTGAFLQRQTAGVQAQNPTIMNDPAALPMLNMFGAVGNLMQYAGNSSPNAQKNQGHSQAPGFQAQGLFNPFGINPPR